MERKPSKRLAEHDEGYYSSDDDDDDDSSAQRHGEETESEQKMEDSYYGAHVEAVSDAMNAESQVRLTPFDVLMLKRRRETNRLSASRRRKRIRDEIQHLQEEQRRLDSETVELTAEKTRLQNELQQLVSSTEQPRTNIVQRQEPHSPQDYIMQLLLLQHQNSQQNSASSVMAPLDLSVASLSHLTRPPSAASDTSSLGNLRSIQNVAHLHDRSATTQSFMPNNLLRYLSAVQPTQETPSLQNPWFLPSLRPDFNRQLLVPQAFAAPPPTDLSRSSAIAAADELLGSRRQVEINASENAASTKRSATDESSQNRTSATTQPYVPNNLLRFAQPTHDTPALLSPWFLPSLRPDFNHELLVSQAFAAPPPADLSRSSANATAEALLGSRRQAEINSGVETNENAASTQRSATDESGQNPLTAQPQLLNNMLRFLPTDHPNQEAPISSLPPLQNPWYVPSIRSDFNLLQAFNTVPSPADLSRSSAIAAADALLGSRLKAEISSGVEADENADASTKKSATDESSQNH